MGVGGWFKGMIKNWLGFTKQENSQSITIQEPLTFDTSVLENRIWYRGDKAELDQFYSQIDDMAGNTTFWSAKSSNNINFRKIHTGLPSLMVDVLTDIVLSDLLGITVDETEAGIVSENQKLWELIAKDNKFDEFLKDVLVDTLVTGDGAFKISMDTDVTDYPIIEFYGADRVEIVADRGRTKEIIFKTNHSKNKEIYILKEYYGKGYIKYKLFDRYGEEKALSTMPELSDLEDVTFDESVMMAIQLKYKKSPKDSIRGCSIFERKHDTFDSLDECVSQWIDSLRDGRVTKYIPESMIPRNPKDGSNRRSNPFDNRYVSTEATMKEGVADQIDVVQPEINTAALLETYVSFLDLAIQGIIAPSTLGIDVKKLDNAEAQREKEKATLYTRDKIINSLTETIPILVKLVLNVYEISESQSVSDFDVSIEFGEYANPSFEAQIETIGKAKSYGIMSIETIVEQLYGDTWTDEQKKAEIDRLKAESGLMADEPSLGNTGDLESDLNADEQIGGAK